MAKTWFITGTSRGFGREWAIAALERGDYVPAQISDEDCACGGHRVWRYDKLAECRDEHPRDHPDSSCPQT
jgi:NAD(P)-dependent dehydrogenase (short-subunit alcohol dehydrogenase family)